MKKYKPTSTLLRFKGFTLVELIVVITILAILGTIGLFSLKNYGATARDSVRISDIKNNLKALAILQIKSTTFPIPESAIEVKSGTGVLISYQGYLGADISRMIGMNTPSLDPKDKSHYTYAIDSVQKKAQLMGYLESGENVKIMSYLNPISYVYAADYLDRHIYVAGDMIGVLTSGADKSPLQSSTTATGINLTSIDTSTYVAYFGGDAFGAGKSTWTGDVLINQLLGAATNTIPCNPVSFNGYSIGSLSHNETKSFSKPVTVSNGSGTGSLAVTCTNGVLNTTTAPENTVVSCTAGFVNTGNNLCTADLCGGSIPVKAHMLGSTQSVSSNWTFAASAGTCTFACDSNYTWNGSDTCVANTQTAPACNGSVVPNATSNATATSWTQTWDGNAWNPVYTYTQNVTPGICTYDCNVGYSWDNANSICTINNYTVSGGFWANAANQTVSVCASSVTADTNGNFTVTLPYGTVCNNISVSRSGYTCSTSTNGPASLTSSVSNIAGSCTPNAYAVSGSFGSNANGATVNVCGTNVTADASGNFSRSNIPSGSACNTIAATRAGFACSTTTNGPASLTANVATVAGSCTDGTAPTWWNFTMPSTTSSTVVTLTITCPTDAAWSTPIQMYTSWAGLASWWNVWETCVSSKNIAVTAWSGVKTITMKWRDGASIPNETGVVSRSVTYTAPTLLWILVWLWVYNGTNNASFTWPSGYSSTTVKSCNSGATCSWLMSVSAASPISSWYNVVYNFSSPSSIRSVTVNEWWSWTHNYKPNFSYYYSDWSSVYISVTCWAAYTYNYSSWNVTYSCTW